MKKFFLLFVVAGLVLTSCGSNAQTQEEAVVEQTEITEVGATEATDSTQVEEGAEAVEAVQE